MRGPARHWHELARMGRKARDLSGTAMRVGYDREGAELDQPEPAVFSRIGYRIRAAIVIFKILAFSAVWPV